MASTIERPGSAIPCKFCTKNSGVTRCEGCNVLVCRPCMSEHVKNLMAELEKTSDDYNEFNEAVTKASEDFQTIKYIAEINQWESESIEKIKQAASEARQQIKDLYQNNIQDIRGYFQEVVEKMKKARQDQGFHDKNLQIWQEKLKQLRNSLESPTSISVIDDRQNFIPKKVVKDMETVNKRFLNLNSNLNLNQEGLLVTNNYNNNSSQYITHIRGQGEYSNGVHQIKFQLKSYPYPNSMFFFGIVTKTAPQNTNWNHISLNGWEIGPNNRLYLDSKALTNHNGYVSNCQVNDILELEIDCYREKIALKNNRTNTINELKINIANCNFPWVFLVRLTMPGESIQILLQ